MTGERHHRTPPTSPGAEAPRGAAPGGTSAPRTPAERTPSVARGGHGSKTGVTCRARGAAGAAAPAVRAALGNYADSPSPGGHTASPDDVAGPSADALAARLRRAERWSLLERARPLTSLGALRKCRKVTLTGTGGPTLRVSGRRGAGYAGLTTCGSVWACPCCAAKIAAARAGELADVMAAVHAAGGSAYLVTYTLRHHRGHRLAELWDAVSAAWGAVTTGKAWVADQVGMLGWARVVEVTHTPRSGWHVHVHTLWAWSEQVDDDHAQRVAFRGWRRWDAALRRRGLDSTPVHGVDARPVRFGEGGLGEYFTKAAREVTASYAKQSRAGRSPFAILRDAVETYLADDVELLWEWERASHGRRQLTWSTAERMDLRRFAGLRGERTDEEIAADEHGGDDVVALTAETWAELTRNAAAPELLDVAEIGGVAGATAWLDARHLGWSRPSLAPRRQSYGPALSPRLRREARAVLTRPPA